MEQKSQSNPSPTNLHRECLKNHAAAIGGHSLDGCGEFMPSPAANLKCAACGCHRNFHRKISPSTASPDEKEFDAKGDTFSALPSARKRFRTKFSAEQKERMRRLSERLGWRLQKRDESLVEDCCREIGVGREVLKVWMHNNKCQMFGGLRRREEKSDVVGEAELNAVNVSSSSS